MNIVDIIANVLKEIILKFLYMKELKNLKLKKIQSAKKIRFG